jgi:Protein of unknown function (DUF3421)
VLTFSRHFDRLLLLSSLLCCFIVSMHAQNGGMLGQSISWQPATSPFTPNASNGAIMGGPGADPNPGSPMYICRARVQGAIVPGKWVQGNCNVPFGGSEQIMNSYEVAYGTARWGGYRGSFYGLAQMGRDVDGSPLYSCRVHYVDASGTDYGYQPGKLVPDGTCHIPFGGAEVTQQPPFEVLYATGGGRPPWNPSYPPSYPYPPPYPPAQVQPFPPCKLGDPGVGLDVNTGWWVGANCSSIDSQGRITQLKYPQPAQPPAYTPPPPPPPPYDPGPSSVTWQPAQKPFVPGQNAIMGGPGNGPKPGSPLYVCRVQYNNNLFPGKWVEGACNFSDDAGKEQSSNTYEVAVGPAEWRDFDGNVGALVPGGVAADGTHLYICRKQISTWGSNRGLQPGWLENGQCHIPYNVDSIYGVPFQALYNVLGPQGANNPQNQGPAAPAQTAAPVQPPSQPHGILISFAGGTAATQGTITVTNGATGATVTKPLPPNSTAQQCMAILQQAALQAALQIQTQADGAGLKIFGLNNAVNVTEASVAISQF